MTKTEQLVKGLLNLGFIEVECKSRKYRAFHKDKSHYYFVGKAAALRFYPENSPTKSFSSEGSIFKKQAMKAGASQ